jgi:hypothetical protein
MGQFIKGPASRPFSNSSRSKKGSSATVAEKKGRSKSVANENARRRGTENAFTVVRTCHCRPVIALTLLSLISTASVLGANIGVGYGARPTALGTIQFPTQKHIWGEVIHWGRFMITIQSTTQRPSGDRIRITMPSFTQCRKRHRAILRSGAFKSQVSS